MSSKECSVPLPWRGVDRRGHPLLLRLSVRRDAPRYLDHLAKLVHETPFMLQGPDDRLPEVVEAKDILDEYAQRDNCVSVVATRPVGSPGRQAILGSVTLVGGRGRRTQHSAELAMGVVASAWGRGLGGLLLDVALTWARKSPTLTRVSLQVYASNTVAVRLYQSRLFVPEGRLRDYACLEDGTFDDLLGMSIDVSGPR